MEMKKYPLPAPKFEKLFRAEVLLGDVYPLGNIGGGYQEIVAVTGGSFEGSIHGEIMSFGGDWGLLYDDTVNNLDTKYLLKTDDGAYISVHCRGRLIMSLEDMQKSDEGLLAEEDYYFRQSISFTTGADPYRWMNEIVAVGISAITDDGNICLDVYKLI
ncbi:DUF3237 domain-containing protein [Ihubacter massiliensis]|uniref:DUF3237 domain-containing protein n=1 Tax=Hominibacterium faecale TaxID=2839743 RepID=A0A9J6QPK4_9FIRM|nr:MULTISPECIES: DUF3237 domain-containing protein [Eubacteriales Family XIII. Incertae Sedis]MCO7122391.1 DUF3237 domain-containing protein [Ihubacter massiliensis]MCU7379280.1 DUF3237 domain-containing protein [Hominibacterium faecale]MDE8732014.1 DUF3237 domain-containing protein [Eubacteriales bacterium DFI.9.88]